MIALKPTDTVNSDILDLSMHSHDVRNRLSTIKSSAELLLKEELQPGQRELVALIQERAWAALDLSASYAFSKTLEAGLYRPFRKDHVLGDLVQSVLVTLRESTGASVRLSVQPGLKLRRWIVCWNGDEQLLLLVLRNAARMMGAALGPGALRLGLDLKRGAIRWSLEAASEVAQVIPV